MAHQVLVMISSDSSKYLEEDDVGSPTQSDAGSNPSVFSGSWASSIFGPPISSDSDSVAYCQCEEGTLLSAPLVGHFLTLILYALGVSEFLSRMHLWIFAM
jgi:hypothetical protein